MTMHGERDLEICTVLLPDGRIWANEPETYPDVDFQPHLGAYAAALCIFGSQLSSSCNYGHESDQANFDTIYIELDSGWFLMLLNLDYKGVLFLLYNERTRGRLSHSWDFHRFWEVPYAAKYLSDLLAGGNPVPIHWPKSGLTRITPQGSYAL